jgi:hypothetical protein
MALTAQSSWFLSLQNEVTASYLSKFLIKFFSRHKAKLLCGLLVDIYHMILMLASYCVIFDNVDP